VADGFADVLGSEEVVPRELVGKLWFIFTTLLSEAESAPAPDAILDAAWEYSERLQKIFGPDFTMPDGGPVHGTEPPT
jgi:hypothetical protein